MLPGAVTHPPSTQGIASRVVAPQRFAGRRPRGGVAGGDQRAAGGVVRAPGPGAARPAVPAGDPPPRREPATRPPGGPGPEAGRAGVVVERRPARRHRVVADRPPLDRPVRPERPVSPGPTPPAPRPVRRHHPRPPRPD